MSAGNGDATAMVFDIERYATEDGPGIRSVVFFKGCSLRCAWCQNPESQSLHPQVLYDRSRCTACRRCVEVCPNGAIHELPGLGFVSDPAGCTLCGRCVDECFSDARRVVGRRMTVSSIMAELDRDRAFYAESGGGVTFSGGEPLLQPEALGALARACRERGYHTAVETAGDVPWRSFEAVLPSVDLLYFDLKHIDPDTHRRWTGIAPARILENLDRAAGCTRVLVVRIPVIPGVNADAATLEAMFRHIAALPRVPHVELLPFHRLGLGKYEGLGVPYAMANVANMSREQCAPLADIGRNLGLHVEVGAS